jgi:nucleoside-diphosphate-sugar epimerase
MEIRKAAIFGATGATGREIGRELARRGIAVRAVSRDRRNLERDFPGNAAERVVADLHAPDAAARASEGCQAIFHCVGLPYPEFADHPILARSTAGAMRRTGAHCLLVSSYYAYEPITRTPIDENHPREPRAFKARMRKEQEDILFDAGAAVTLLPDFYGPGVEASMLGLALRDLVRGRTANWIGPLDVLRQHIYVPDAARILVDLAQREEAYGQRWNVATTGGIRMAEALEIVERILHRKPRIRTAGVMTLRIGGLFNPLLRELVELHPLYSGPMVLDGSKLGRLLGSVRTTSYEDGIRATIDSMRGIAAGVGGE